VKFRRVSAVWNNKNLSFVLPQHFKGTEICFGNDQNYKAVPVAIFGRDKCVCESYELTIESFIVLHPVELNLPGECLRRVEGNSKIERFSKIK
jgi:hypothetical protein